MGQNFGASPFAAAPRKQPYAMPRNDGFSEDGLSYAVIDDFSKLASQALAEYEARIKKPRTDIWGKTLQADTPAALDAELFQPLRNLFGGAAVNAGLKTYEIDNNLIGFNPTTNQTQKLFEGNKKPEKALTDFEEKQLDHLRTLQRTLQGKRRLVGNDAQVLKQTEEAIAQLEGKAVPKQNQAAAPSGPRIGGDWPIQGSFIGTPGKTNMFSAVVSPFSPTNSTPQVRRRFNPVTQRLE